MQAFFNLVNKPKIMKVIFNQFLIILIFILLTSIYSCRKENIVSINPFESINTSHVINKDNSISIKVKLPDHSYSEVGIYYSENKQELELGKSTLKKDSQKKSDEYEVIVNNINTYKPLYYRVYVKQNDQEVLSTIYEIYGLKYNLKAKFPDNWIQIQDDNNIEIKLIGENLDLDVKKYSTHDDYGLSDLTKVQIDKLEDNKYEITLSFYYRKFLGSTDWGFELLFDNKKIYTFTTTKLRPPKGYGLYYLNRISRKAYSNTFDLLFQHNNDFFAIGNNKIEAYDYDRQFWYMLRDMPNNIIFNGASYFIDQDTLFCTAVGRDSSYVKKKSNKLTLAKLSLKTYETDFIDFDMVNPPQFKADDYGFQCEVHKFQSKEYLILYEHIEHNKQETYLFEIDRKNRKLNFILDYSDLTTNIVPRLLSYKNELYIVGVDYAKSDPHNEIYVSKLFKLDIAKKTTLLIKEWIAEDLRYVTYSQNQNMLWILGANRSIFSVDFDNKYELTKYIHVYKQNGVFLLTDFIDVDEVEGRFFFRNNKLIFGAGFHTQGMFEVNIENYEN